MPEIWFPNLGIEIDELNRVAFSIFGTDVYWYGIIITLGIVLGLSMTVKEAKRTGQDPDFYIDSLMVTIISALIFARIYYVVFSWDYFKDNLNEIFSLRNGGLAIYGGIIGGGLALFIYSKIKRVSFLKVGDTWILGLLIGQILGRWGNFINREAFGGYTDSIFALRYIKEQVSAPMSDEILQNTIIQQGVEYIQVHPTFLYESFWNIGVFALIFLYRKHKKFDGELVLLYFIGYGIGRFWIEGLRTDALLIGGTDMAISRVLSLVLAVACIIIIFIKRKNLYIKGGNKNGIEADRN